MKKSIACFVVLAANLAAAQQPSWTVKPEWVRAHEEFLSSDVMAGRGSATRDEEITATYVASEFMGYGLKTAPGMTGYIQAADLQSPMLDGKATLKVGDVTLHEGTDFQLLSATGTDIQASQGSIRRIGGDDLKSPPRAANGVLLLDSVPSGMSAMQATRSLRRSGAAIVAVVQDESTQQAFTAAGGKTRTPLGLPGAPSRGSNLIAVTRDAMARLVAAKDAQTTLTVHEAEHPVRKTFNAIGYLEGSDLASGTILLTAHLDHVGTGDPVNGDAIYNGANDDAAGTTAVLELAHALASGPKLKRSILFVCYGSEEAGELGSTYFGEHPPVPLKDLVTNLEFEMIGNQDPKMPKGVLLLTGWDRSNLGPTLREHGALLGPDPYPEQHFFERSDNYALALKGVVAHTAAGWGTPPTYHQPNDDMAHLDIPFMTAAIQSLVEPIRWLASSDFRPQWNPNGQPSR